jgi:hypothetical protein
MLRVVAAPISTRVRMSAQAGSATESSLTRIASSGRLIAAAKATGVAGGSTAASRGRKCLAELPGARLRQRIVEGDDEAGLGRRPEPLQHHVPGLQVVRQGDGAEVPAQRRPQTRGGGEHGRDPGHDLDLQIAPGGIAPLHRLEHRRGHGEDAGVAAGADRHRPPLRGQHQGVAGAIELFAIVGRMAALAGALGNTCEIGAIAHQVLRRRQNSLGLGRAHRVRPGPEPHHIEPPAHRAPRRPGTSTSEK